MSVLVVFQDALVESMALVHSSLTQLTSRWKQLTEQLAEGCAGVEECKGEVIIL